MLEHAMGRDRSPSTLAAVIPLLRHIADATSGTERELIDAGVLARALWLAGRISEAESSMRNIIGRGAQRGEYRTATAVSGDLMTLLCGTGRYGEALALVDQRKEHIRRADTAGVIARVDGFEKRINRMEAEAELVNYGRKPSLEQEFERLVGDEELEQELDELRAKVKGESEKAKVKAKSEENE